MCAEPDMIGSLADSRIPSMVPPFDIFRVKDGSPLWAESVQTLDEAKARVQQLGVSQPGEYLIYSQKTGNKTSIKVEQS
jgi:hypothetical protein